MGDGTDGTAKKADKLLAKLRQGDSVSAACRAQRIGRTTYYRWRREDAEFAATADDAIEEGTDMLEDVAKRRAKAVSDTLLIFLLKARRPDKYRERSTLEHTGANGGPLTITLDSRPDGPA